MANSLRLLGSRASADRGRKPPRSNLWCGEEGKLGAVYSQSTLSLAKCEGVLAASSVDSVSVCETLILSLLEIQ